MRTLGPPTPRADLGTPPPRRAKLLARLDLAIVPEREVVTSAGSSAAPLPTPATPPRPAAAHSALTPDLLDTLGQPANLARLLILTGGFIWYFHFWFWQQHRIAYDNPSDWGHTYFVPLVCVYLLWQVRDGFTRAPKEAFWPGLLALVLGIVSYLFFVVGVPNHLGRGLSMVLTLFGVVLLMLGPRAMRFLFFPVAYMVFAITLPEKWMIELTFPLQLIASKGSYILLKIIGVSLSLKGNVLNVIDSNGDPQPLNVAEQCAGMRTLVSFVALGAAICLVGATAWWKRVVLMAMTIPIAVGLNILRVAVLAYLAQYNPELSRGEAHTFIGMLLLIPGFFSYLGIVWVLNKAAPESAAPETGAASPPGPKAVSA